MTLESLLFELVNSDRMQAVIAWYRIESEQNKKERLVRRYAYQRIRRLVASDELPQLTVDEFNKNILQIGGITYRGKKYTEQPFCEKRSFLELEAMFASGEIQTVGNCTWGFGAGSIRAFFAKSEYKLILPQLQSALQSLQDKSMPIRERLQKAKTVSGLWPNLTTGILMTCEPGEWIVLNGKSTDALNRLGLLEKFSTDIDSYLLYNDFAKQVQVKYNLADLAEVDAMFSRLVDIPEKLVAQTIAQWPKVILIGSSAEKHERDDVWLVPAKEMLERTGKVASGWSFNPDSAYIDQLKYSLPTWLYISFGGNITMRWHIVDFEGPESDSISSSWPDHTLPEQRGKKELQSATTGKTRAIRMWFLIDRFESLPTALHSRDLTPLTKDRYFGPGPKNFAFMHELPPQDTLAAFSSYLAAMGFYFPPHLIASYYLALQTKPFVILTGISGTGKTKLAQLFAEWTSPSVQVETVVQDVPRDDGNSFWLTVRRTYLTSGIVLPKTAYGFFNVPNLGQTINITVELQEPEETVECSLRYQQRLPSGDFLYFSYKKKVQESIKKRFQVGDILQFEVIEEDTRYRLKKFIPTTQQIVKHLASRLAFVSVRPDWTDNRGLLGFYNLITTKYQITDFLRLLIQATRDRDDPHFVILDEMNLAKVEYYFADFLSVLESRYRLSDGELKQEALHLHDLPRCVLVQGEPSWEQDAEQFMCMVRCENCPLRAGVDRQQWLYGESDYDEACKTGFDCTKYVPPRLFIPRNVYFSGTVNVDETTYMFSPKVLDRANTIEFNEVDLQSYFDQGTAAGDAKTASNAMRRAFTFEGQFVRLSQDVPLRTDKNLAQYRQILITLSELLRPYRMHFGYRVADEVLLYLWNAQVLNDPDFNLDIAFDHQLCQKILPKFYGSQAKLEEPLRRMLRFCIDPEKPNTESDSAQTKDQSIDDLGRSVAELRLAKVRYPYAAHKILSMLDALRKEGFASFA